MIKNTERRAKAFAEFKNLAQPKTESSDFTCHLDNGSDGGEIVLTVRGVVGDEWEENDHKTVVEALQAAPDAKVTLYVNSMGGSVFDGFGIFNALSSHKGEVTAIIEGIAYSAASFLVLAADKVIAHEVSAYGLHRAMRATFGNQVDHRGSIQQLDTIDTILIDLYSAKTGMKADEIVAMLDADTDGTMLTAKAALEMGFVDEIFDPKKAPAAPSKDDEEDEDEDAPTQAALDAQFQAHKAGRRKKQGIAARVRIREIARKLLSPAKILVLAALITSGCCGTVDCCSVACYCADGADCQCVAGQCQCEACPCDGDCK